MNEYENINRIDNLLQPEVDREINAIEKSFKKYGNIFHADEFKISDKKPLRWYQKIFK